VSPMETKSDAIRAHRVTDLVNLKKGGAQVTCRTSFDVILVEFQQRENPYRAHVFVCYFSGEVNGEHFAFRKCYARGCSHNLCPHVSQAVMIANRYLQRDYRTLQQAGIAVEERLFTLDEMIVKFPETQGDLSPTLTIEDYIYIAGEGNRTKVQVETALVQAVEHFSNYKKTQIFLTADFRVETLGKTHLVQRCFACYPIEREAKEKTTQVQVANQRLAALYRQFDEASIEYEQRFFI